MFEPIGVAFLQESKEAAGYPKSTTGGAEVPECINALGKAPQGSGHDCFLKGICVQLDVIATAYEWQQVQRYHWFDIVSSQSKMHCISEFDIEVMCSTNVDMSTIEAVEERVVLYNEGEITREELLDNLPMGLKLRARCVTNYLQLKTMFKQRKHHRLEFWNDRFVDYCHNLPEFIELIGEEVR